MKEITFKVGCVAVAAGSSLVSKEILKKLYWASFKTLAPAFVKPVARAGALLIVLFLLAVPLSVRADVKMPAIFGDHMVLQKGMDVPLWGTADPAEAVTVTAGSSSAKATAGPDGKWEVKLTKLAASGTPIDVTVAGKNTLTFHDVLVGDVWLCSGQSNMQFGLDKKPFGGDAQRAKYLPEANDPQLRFFLVKRIAAVAPAENVQGQWKVCTPASAGPFSAVGYFFGRELRASRKIPVGLIGSYWGGTMIEAWGHPDPKLAGRDTKNRLQNEPSSLFNGMISPLIPYALTGAIWYQGESNVDFPTNYHALFSAMIQDWRTRWNEGDFPFLWVQLAGYRGRPDQDWSLLREAQLQTLSLPKTGMASAVDIGVPKNVHPADKFDVGHRLALAALHVAYGEKVVDSGPLYKEMKVSGDAVRLTFNHEGGGLKIGQAPWVPPGSQPIPTASLVGFVIAGDDKKWVPADAKIDGDAVVVSSPQVSHPAAVRYAWENSPQSNLYNQEDLPASPFRTDDWASDAAPKSNLPAEVPAPAASGSTNAAPAQ